VFAELNRTGYIDASLYWNWR